MNLFSTGSERKRPQEIVGLDFSSTGVKAVRLKRSDDQFTLAAMDIFPPGSDPTAGVARPPLGKQFTTNYVALTFSAPSCAVRVVAHTGTHATEIEKQVRDQIGLDTTFRLSNVPSGQPVRNKNENRVLAVGAPDKEVQEILDLFKEGAPAPFSLEVSGLASLNAALDGPVAKNPDAPACLLDCGSRTSMMVFVNKGAIILARKLDVGGDAVVEHVQKNLGVEREMAQNIMSEGAIDISQAVREVIDPFLRQMMISRDFVERQENCRVTTAFITGGMSMSAYWINEIRKATGIGVQMWDPLEGMNVASGAIQEKWAGQQSRFTAAIGAAKGALLTP